MYDTIWNTFMGEYFSVGFSEKQLDDIKGVFFDTSLWLFLITMFVTFFHVSHVLHPRSARNSWL